MIMKSHENGVEEINVLVQALDISAKDAIEIINIFFECFADSCTYQRYLWDNIRVIRDTPENQQAIAELETIDDVCLFKGDDYCLITNYQALINDGLIGNFLPNPF